MQFGPVAAVSYAVGRVSRWAGREGLGVGWAVFGFFRLHNDKPDKQAANNAVHYPHPVRNPLICPGIQIHPSGSKVEDKKV